MLGNLLSFLYSCAGVTEPALVCVDHHHAAHFAENAVSPLLELLSDLLPLIRIFEKDRSMVMNMFTEVRVFVSFTTIIIAPSDQTLKLSYNDVFLRDLCACCQNPFRSRIGS